MYKPEFEHVNPDYFLISSLHELKLELPLIEILFRKSLRK